MAMHSSASPNGHAQLHASFLPSELVIIVSRCPYPVGTITVNDTLDLLAEHMGVGPEVAELTNKARKRGGRVSWS